MKRGEQIVTWGIAMLLFLFVALFSIATALQPVKEHIGNQVIANSALTNDGLISRVEAWKEYPEYNKGLAIIAGFSFVGAIYACRMMFAIKEHQNDTPQSKSRAG